MSPEEIAILDTVAKLKQGKTASPEEVARFVAAGGEAEAWRKRLPHVRQAAKHLARTGQISIYRKGKVANPDDFKGVWRLGRFQERLVAVHESLSQETVEQADDGEDGV
jgi:Protein of unknown function (DUF3253)